MRQVEWISRNEAARRLGVHQHCVIKVIRAGKVRVRQLPGLDDRYSAEDIARIAANAIQVAGRRS